MKEQLPSPDFNFKKYERPNQKWVCGWLCEGCPCPNGPDGKGRCGAVADCQPTLQAGSGNEKPFFVCNRSKELGGPCEEGPRPDGTCCHPPKKCQPRLSLRVKRGLFTRGVIAFTCGVLLLILYGGWRWNFISPGPVSVQHNSEAFQQLARKYGAEQHGGEQRCSACHSVAKGGPVSWLQSALNADPAPHQFEKLLLNSKPVATRIDSNCQQCHPQHTFHEPNVPWNYSCSACHQEHMGARRLKQVDSAHCVTCHGDARAMETAVRKGHTLESGAFDFQHDFTRLSFAMSRPTNGYTKVIREFSLDHPEFQIHTGNFKDANTLRFNHATHQAENPKMPLLKGEKLNCASCHQPGADGVYYGKVSFEKNCQSCHALQFDPEIADLNLPHGNASFVHAFLRSLPQQYADYATRTKKITAKKEVDKFVRDRMSSLRAIFGTGEELEQKVFYSDERTAPTSNIGNLGNKGRSLFPGCAYCHEVKAGVEFPKITPPVMVERWMSQGKFNHAKHTGVGCLTCHGQAVSSRESLDIMLPSQATCASCHNSKGSARNDCAECHTFHRLPLEQLGNLLRK